MTEKLRRARYYREHKAERDAYGKQWRAKNREWVKRYNNNLHKLLKDSVFDFYGWKCACCGEEHRTFLSVDHINNDGNRERRGSDKRRLSGVALYRQIVKRNFPPTFQVLCMNCNFSKHFGGRGMCEHQIKNAEALTKLVDKLDK